MQVNEIASLCHINKWDKVINKLHPVAVSILPGVTQKPNRSVFTSQSMF